MLDSYPILIILLIYCFTEDEESRLQYLLKKLGNIVWVLWKQIIEVWKYIFRKLQS